MKNNILLIFFIIFFTFCFYIFFKSLNNSNTYIPTKLLKDNLITFDSKELFSNTEISSEEIFVDSNFYILNIWSSWCVPCREEHSELMKLKNRSSIKLIGLNYKDKPKNAKNFIKTFGNPFSLIITDIDGTIAIELGAYGVPETFIINNDKKIIKKIVGPLNESILQEINLILK